jgi:rubredoxin
MSHGPVMARHGVDRSGTESSREAALDSAVGDGPASMECRICWHVYDPEIGDDQGQVPPGTPFTELPDDWRCPNCDADKDHFLVIDPAGH